MAFRRAFERHPQKMGEYIAKITFTGEKIKTQMGGGYEFPPILTVQMDP